MKVLDQQRQETTDLPEAETLTTEALIKEARRRQRLRWLSIGVAALLFVLAGVVLATHFASPAKKSVTSTSTTKGSGAICPASQLTIGIGPDVGPVVGEDPIVVRLTNRGLSPCSMFGYPLVTLLGASQQVLRFTYQHTPPGPFDMTTAPPHRVTLLPGATAFVELAKEACSTISTPATVLELEMPGMGNQLALRRIDSFYGYCKGGSGMVGNQIATTPVEPSVHKLYQFPWPPSS